MLTVLNNGKAITRAPKSTCDSEPAAFHATTPSLFKIIPTPWDPQFPLTSFFLSPEVIIL